MSDRGSRPKTGNVSLEASAQELRRRAEATARLQGGPTHYLEECALFRDFAEEKQLILGKEPEALTRQPDDEGNEHQVWFDSNKGAYLKATWPDFYGMRVIHRHDEEPKASPVQYLERWLLHNQVFGDHVEFLGVLNTEQGHRLLIRQPAINGRPATEKNIRSFFSQEGWLPFRAGGELAFFDRQRDIVISDTHRGNIILMDDGLLAPIDLRIEKVSGALLDTVMRLCDEKP